MKTHLPLFIKYLKYTFDFRTLRSLLLPVLKAWPGYFSDFATASAQLLINIFLFITLPIWFIPVTFRKFVKEREREVD